VLQKTGLSTLIGVPMMRERGGNGGRKLPVYLKKKKQNLLIKLGRSVTSKQNKYERKPHLHTL
jgi:hypothetical protein